MRFVHSTSESSLLHPSPPGPRRVGRLLHRSADGQSIVEFAMCVPVLLLVVTGILTFGLAVNNYVMLTNAVNVGARQLAILSQQTTDPCADVAKTVKAAAPNLNPSNLSFTLLLNGTSYSGTSCSSGSTTTGAAGKLVSGAPAQLTVTYPCAVMVYGVDYAPSGCTLTAQTTELVQ